MSEADVFSPSRPSAHANQRQRHRLSHEDGSSYDADEVAVQRAQISAIQSRSSSFRGFSEDELDALFPLLTICEFNEGDTIMKTGEEASWAGVLLGGELEALLPWSPGNVVGRVTPGTVVGEMALFRGGKRGCDMRATSAGSIAVLKFASLDTLDNNVALLHKLLRIFGREAYLHTVNAQASPFLEPAKPSGARWTMAFDLTHTRVCPTPLHTRHERF